MHASFLLAATILAPFLAAFPLSSSSTSATTQDSHPQLVRRFIPNPLTIGLGAGGVDLNRENRRRIDELKDRVRHLRDEVTFLKGREQMLQGGPRLIRRQLGTVLGATGIHKSRENRRDLDDMDNQVGGMRTDVNWMLQMEHLGLHGMATHLGDAGHMENGREDVHIDDELSEDPEESDPVDESAAPEEPQVADDHHHLERRQLGIILGPIAIGMAKSDRDRLENLRARIDSLQSDCARVRTAQGQRLRFGSAAGLRSSSTTITASTGGDNTILETSQSGLPVFAHSAGVLGTSEVRPFHDGWTSGPTVDDGAFIPRFGNGDHHRSSSGHHRSSGSHHHSSGGHHRSSGGHHRSSGGSYGRPSRYH